MRFLMLNWRDPRNPKTGGAERVTLAHLRALVERGHEVFWFANDFPGASREESFQGLSIVRGGGYGSSVLAARKWYRQQPRFDLVMDQHHGIPWYAPWWAGTNTVAYIHEVLGPIWGAFYQWPISTIGPWQERWTHWLYRKVPFWTPSDSTKQALHRNGVREVKVILNGIDTKPLPMLPAKPLTVPVRLIAVSRLAPNKRIDHALRATDLLNQRGVPATLTVVGGGEDEPRLKALAGELSCAARIHFTGSLSEAAKNEAMAGAHLLLHTSIREGWGLNVTEANALGTPAIVYPVPGLVDSTVPGETGRVTQDETPAAVADEVAALLQQPVTYEAYRQAAWARAKTFQWDRVLPQVVAWLEGEACRRTRG